MSLTIVAADEAGQRRLERERESIVVLLSLRANPIGFMSVRVPGIERYGSNLKFCEF